MKESVYDPYSKVKEPSNRWIDNQVTSSVILTGLGVMGAMNMKGPAGKILMKEYNRIIDKKAEQAIDAFDHAKNTSAASEVSGMDFKYNKIGDYDIVDPLSESSMSNATEKLYGKSGIQSPAVGSSRRVEDSLSKLINEKDPMSLRGWDTDTYDIFVAKVRLQTLEKYRSRDMIYHEGAPSMNISEMSRSLHDNYTKIGKIHDFYMEHDTLYARSYYEDIKRASKHVHTSLEGRAASNNIAANLAPVSIDITENLVPKEYTDMIPTMNSYTVKADRVDKIYEASGSKLLSQELMESTTRNKTRFSDKTSLHVSKYRNDLTTIAKTLDKVRMANPGQIEETFIREAHYGTSGSYIIIGIKKASIKSDGQWVELKVPVAENGLVPGMNIRDKPYFNVKTILGANKGVNDIIDSTTESLRVVNRALDGSLLHLLFDERSPKIFEHAVEDQVKQKLMNNGIVSDELRDFFKTESHRHAIIDQLFVNNKSKRVIDKASHGVNSLRNLRKIKKNADKYMVLYLDLETINLHKESPSLHATDPLTGIWQASTVLTDGHGSVMDIKEFKSDHVLNDFLPLNDDFSKESLRKILNETSERGSSLRGLASYAKRTMEKENPNVTYATQEDAIIAFKKHISRESVASANRYKNSKYKNPIRSNGDMARLVGRLVEDAKHKAHKEGKQLILAGTNIIDFDLLILKNHGLSIDLKDVIDVNSLVHSSNLGKVESSAMAASSITNKLLSRLGIDTSKIVDFETNPDKYLELYNTHGLLRAGDGSPTIHGMMRSILGQDTYTAHTSAAFDNINSAANVRILLDTEDISEVRIGRLHNELKQAKSGTVSDLLRRQLSLEGTPIGDGFGSMTLLSSNQTSKFLLSTMHAGLVFPTMVENPLYKDMGQMHRNVWIKRPTVKTTDSDFRFGSYLESTYLLKAEKWMHQRADWMGNHLAHQVQYNTVYMVGRSGTQQGSIQILNEVLDFKTWRYREVAMNEALDINDPVLRNSIRHFFGEVEQEAKAMAGRGRHADVKPNDISPAIWKEASMAVRARMEKTLPVLDPSKSSHMPFFDKTYRSNLPGIVTGFSIDTSPTALGENQAKFLLQIETIADAKRGFGTLAANSFGMKALISTVDTKSAELAYGKYGMAGKAEVVANFDFIDKRYWGSLKHSMLHKALGLAAMRANPNNGYSRQEQADALGVMKKIAAKINESLPARFNPETLRVTVGYDNMDISMQDAVKRISTLSMDTVFDALQMVGHEATWDLNKVDILYKHFGGDDFWLGRDRVNKIMSDMLDDATIKNATAAGNAAEAIELRNLIGRMDPLYVAEQRLRGRNELRGGSIRKHWEGLTNAQRNSLLKTIPIFTQIVIDHNKQEGLGMFGYAQAYNFYNVDNGTQPDFRQTVTFQRNYYENFLRSPLVPGHVKSLLTSSTGYNNDSYYQKVAVKHSKMLKIISDSVVTKKMLGTSTLTYEEIQSLTSGDITKAAVAKLRLTQGQYKMDSFEVRSLDRSMDKLKLYTDEMADVINEEGSKFSRIETIEGKLDYINKKFIHRDEIHNVWMKHANAKDNIWILPSKMTIKEGGVSKEVGTKEFRFVLEESIDMLNADKSMSKINKNTMIKQFMDRHAIKNNTPDSEKLFNIKMENGKHIVTMKGLVLPVGDHIGDYGHNLIDEFHTKSSDHKALGSILEAYKEYLEIFRNNKKFADSGQVEGHSKRLGTQWLKFMINNMAYDKDSPAFKATQTHVSGINMVFHTSDAVVTRARSLLEALEAGDDSVLGKYKLTRDKAIPVLRNISTASPNLAIMSAKTFQDGNPLFNLTGGGNVSLAEKMDSSFKEIQDAWSMIMSGRSTLPGGFMPRFPVSQNGVIPGIGAELLLIPEDMRELLGVSAEQIYLHSAVADMIKADNDVDRTSFILKDFKNIEEMNELRKETRKTLGEFVDSEPGKRFLTKYNEAGFISHNKRVDGKIVYAVSQVDMNRASPTFMQNITVDKAPHELPWGKQYLNGLIDNDMVIRSMLGKTGNEAVKQHINTVSLNAFSKNFIPLMVNTMRQKVHEMYQGEVGLVRDPRVLMELVGDLNHGAMGWSQEAISLAKHGDIPRTLEMVKAFESMKGKDGLSAEGYAMLEKSWMKMYGKIGEGGMTAEQKRGKAALNLILGKTQALDYIRSVNPDVKTVTGSQDKLNLGLQGTHIFHASDLKTINAKLDEIQVSALTELSNYAEQFTDDNMMDGPLGSKEYTLSLFDTAAGTAEPDNLDAKFKARFITPRTTKFFKSAGKYAAIAAAAYIGLNFFRPHQMSNSMNPLDSFIDLGTNINGDNAPIVGEPLQLDRRNPLDMVNSSFGNSAFIRRNEIQNATRLQSSLIKDTMRQSKMYATYGVRNPFRSEENITYTNYTRKTGSFNSHNYQRRKT